MVNEQSIKIRKEDHKWLSQVSGKTNVPIKYIIKEAIAWLKKKRKKGG